MYISDNKGFKKRASKIALIHLAAAAFCVAFDKVYAIFGHGVYSASMSLMFLYPLAGGALVFLALRMFLKNEPARFRLFYNSYNSGIAAFTAGSALSGIFEIAGTSSPYTVILTLCGILLCAAGAIVLITGGPVSRGQ